MFLKAQLQCAYAYRLLMEQAVTTINIWRLNDAFFKISAASVVNFQKTFFVEKINTI